MATTGLSIGMLNDAAIKGGAIRAFRAVDQRSTPRYKQMGFENIPTTTSFYEFTSFSGIGTAPIKEEFGQIAIDTPKQGYTKRVSPVPRAIMVPISQEMARYMSRGAESEIKKALNISKMVSESLSNTNETLAADVLGNAFSTSFLHPDGQPLISASHKLLRGGATESNSVGAVSISQESLEAVLIQGRKMRDDTGFPIGVGDGKRILITQEDPSFDIKRILESTLQSDTANNAKNVLKGEGIDHVTNTFLPSTTNWFVRNMSQEDCLVEVVETEKMMGDFGDDKTMIKFISGYMNKVFDFWNWRGIQGSSF